MAGTTSSLISPEYQAEQARMHRDLPGYGVASQHFAPQVARFCQSVGAASLLDYGAGKQRLLAGLREHGYTGTYTAYDPAIEAISECPGGPYDVVACIDVLEHIEPDRLRGVLAHMASVTTRHGYFTIHTGPANKRLSDGRNAHLIQQSESWWIDRINDHWSVLQSRIEGHNVIVRVEGAGHREKRECCV